MRAPLGFDPANVLTTEVSLLSPRYDDQQRRESFFRELQERIQSAPGDTNAGFISELPLSGEGNDTFFTITEHPPANPSDNEDADFRVVAGDYFGAMRIPLLAGRTFEREDASEARQVIVVNEPFAKKFFPHGSAIGKHVKLYEGKPQFATREIVGIVGGNKHFALQESLQAAETELEHPHYPERRARRGRSCRADGNGPRGAPPDRSGRSHFHLPHHGGCRIQFSGK